MDYEVKGGDRVCTLILVCVCVCVCVCCKPIRGKWGRVAMFYHFVSLALQTGGPFVCVCVCVCVCVFECVCVCV